MPQSVLRPSTSPAFFMPEAIAALGSMDLAQATADSTRPFIFCAMPLSATAQPQSRYWPTTPASATASSFCAACDEGAPRMLVH